MTTGDTAASGRGAPIDRRSLGTADRRYGEAAIKLLLALCAAVSVTVTTGIVLSLLAPTIGFFREVPIGEFLVPHLMLWTADATVVAVPHDEAARLVPGFDRVAEIRCGELGADQVRVGELHAGAVQQIGDEAAMRATIDGPANRCSPPPQPCR